MSEIYLSFASKDESFAQKVRALLEKNNFTVANLPLGKTPDKGFIEQVQQELRAADVVIMLFSPAALEARTMQAEITQAQHLRKPIAVSYTHLTLPTNREV